MTRFLYEGNHTNEISFPLGGIGAGCIGLAGNGRLIDWEIFNHPDKGSLNGMSHFAVRAERDGQVLDARILHGDLQPPYSGEMGQRMFRGFGWGPRRENLAGMPHFREHTFHGEYPFAEVTFEGEPTFPGRVALHAWSPLIPGDTDDSCLPGAFFEIEIENTGTTTIDYTVVGALSNPFGQANAQNRVTRHSFTRGDNRTCHQLTLANTGKPADDPGYGDLTLSTDADDVSYQAYWIRGRWCDDLEIYWQELNQPGRFTNRDYTEGMQTGYTGRDTGHLAAHLSLSPGEKRRVRFAITWHVPNCRNYWRSDADSRAADAGLANAWRNWYATQWENSAASGLYAMEEWARVQAGTEAFHDALFGSTLPAVAVEAVSANLSTLKSPTCLRLEDGTFYGWEGSGTTSGSCEGSCTHVWNYTQALPFLFPDLERSMRTANYRYNVDALGGSHFRIHLPLGVHAKPTDFRPCADGQFGDVIKTYREWRISGDTDWLSSLWPAIRHTIEYAWSDDNPDRWDPEQTGVLWGRQHHTLDMELFGPNAWLTGYYLGALKAAAEMANVCDDQDFGAHCHELFEKGKSWADEHLFNGEYYLQRVDLEDRALIEQFDFNQPDGSHQGPADALDNYWSEELGEIKYQIGEGCELDMTIAQWHANLYGLGEIYDPEQVRSALAATFKYNFKSTMRDEANPWRIYALNDEAGLQICSWPPHVRRPRIPLPYAQEDQNGYTYAAAIQMIQSGLIEEGLTVIRALRDRYDGFKRNPWNEIECGSNYARSMASYALLNTFAGFQFDMRRGMIGFNPLSLPEGEFRCFWSLGCGWGTYHQTKHSRAEVRLLHGSLTLETLHLPPFADQQVSSVTLDGEAIPFTQNRSEIQFASPVRCNKGQRLQVISVT